MRVWASGVSSERKRGRPRHQSCNRMSCTHLLYGSLGRKHLQRQYDRLQSCLGLDTGFGERAEHSTPVIARPNVSHLHSFSNLLLAAYEPARYVQSTSCTASFTKSVSPGTESPLTFETITKLSHESLQTLCIHIISVCQTFHAVHVSIASFMPPYPSATHACPLLRS